MNIGLALVFGVLYWLATNKLWYGTLHLVRQPLVLAVPIGLIMGNLGDAMKIGASLQMIYLGAIAPGGTLPADEALASCITIPVALAAGLEPDIAVTIAVPVGLLGVLLDNLRQWAERNSGIRSSVPFRCVFFRQHWHCCLEPMPYPRS